MTTLRFKRVPRAVELGHPWIYADVLTGPPTVPGQVVTLVAPDGRMVATGYADAGPIGVRVLARGQVRIDTPFFDRRLASAAALRRNIVPADTNALRIVHGEGDRLPGIVVDQYDRFAVLRFDGAGARKLLPLLEPSLKRLLPKLGCSSLLLREGRGKDKSVKSLVGSLPDAPITVLERGMKLVTDLRFGQKTGLFLDHRDSRALVRSCSAGKRVLNLYGYTGGFSIAAALGGATEVVTVDIASAALEMAERTFRANGLDDFSHRTVPADVPEFLRSERSLFDLVIADPPSFAPNAAAVRNALASYRKLHLACLAKLMPGGLYLAASCSSHIDEQAFRATLAEAATQAGRSVQVLARQGAAPDHPCLLSFPEGDYLKVLLCRVES